MLAALIDLVRDIALLAAATGVAWWCWEQFRTAASRSDEVARAGLAAERQAADLKQWAGISDTRSELIAFHLGELVAAEQAKDAIAADKVRVHRLLQASTEPFLTFSEIERVLANVGRHASALPTIVPEPSGPVEPVVGDRLRRVLIELVSDGVVAQLDRDRYFIASDYETAGDEEKPEEAA